MAIRHCRWSSRAHKFILYLTLLFETSAFVPRSRQDHAIHRCYRPHHTQITRRSSIPQWAERTKNVLATKTDSQQQQKQQQQDAGGLLGLLVLATVPIVWGSYAPVVKSMYDLDPPVPGFVFSASYLAVAALSSLAILYSSSEEQPQIIIDDDDDDASFPVEAGLELGLYTFLANSLQVVGLETVSSDRAGFLIQCK